MAQKHIGYTSWNDNFRANIMPGRIPDREIPERQREAMSFYGQVWRGVYGGRALFRGKSFGISRLAGHSLFGTYVERCGIDAPLGAWKARR